MNLRRFIRKLKEIEEKHGKDTEVILADNVPAVDPVFSRNYPGKKSVVITDEK